LQLLCARPAAFATKIPIPIEGATLNVSVQVQTQTLINENGAPNGSDPSYDLYVRRTRILVNGDISQNFSYLFQVDNAKLREVRGTSPAAPSCRTHGSGGRRPESPAQTSLHRRGLLLIPISHHLLESTTNFITADVHTDEFRFPVNPFRDCVRPACRSAAGGSTRKVGFRGGVYEGVAPIATPGIATTTTPASVCVLPGTPPRPRPRRLRPPASP